MYTEFYNIVMVVCKLFLILAQNIISKIMKSNYNYKTMLEDTEYTKI